MSSQYINNFFQFCSASQPLEKRETMCDGEVKKTLPKKVVVFSKPGSQFSKKEVLAWASRNKYR